MCCDDVLCDSAKIIFNLFFPPFNPQVEDIIAQLGLTNCRHTKIGDALTRGVSGGERKRVAIGIELVRYVICSFACVWFLRPQLLLRSKKYRFCFKPMLRELQSFLDVHFVKTYLNNSLFVPES